MSKEERAKLAIAKRAQEIKEQREKEEQQKKQREDFEREADTLRAKERQREADNRYGRGSRCQCISSHPTSVHQVTISLVPTDDDYANDRERDSRGSRRDQRGGRRNDRDRPPQPAGPQNVPTGPRADRDKAQASSSAPSNNSKSMPPPQAVNGSSELADRSNNFVLEMNDNDLSAIRSRYLGVDKKKRRIRKMTDRKFVFDWDAQDDTLTEDSPMAVGANRQGAQVMFGRGHLAGMDDGGDTRRSSSDVKFSDSLERRKAAKSGHDERHWTEKPLSEMKDRDWRIFREDFSISARGTHAFPGSMPVHLSNCTATRWTDPTPFKVLEGIDYPGNHSRGY